MDDLKWCINNLSSFNKKDLSGGYTFEMFRALMNITMPINLSDEYFFPTLFSCDIRISSFGINSPSSVVEPISVTVSLFIVVNGFILHLHLLLVYPLLSQDCQ